MRLRIFAPVAPAASAATVTSGRCAPLDPLAARGRGRHSRRVSLASAGPGTRTARSLGSLGTGATWTAQPTRFPRFSSSDGAVATGTARTARSFHSLGAVASGTAWMPNSSCSGGFGVMKEIAKLPWCDGDGDSADGALLLFRRIRRRNNGNGANGALPSLPWRGGDGDRADGALSSLRFICSSGAMFPYEFPSTESGVYSHPTFSKADLACV